MNKPKKDKSEKDDPTWSRSNRNKKSQKMCSRGALRALRSLIQKKRAADRLQGIEKTVCVTRTVELPSTENIGDQRNKLLFMIALGLVPNRQGPDHAKRHLPLIMVEKLDPLLEAQAATKTTERIFELLQKRQVQQVQGRVMYHVKVKPTKKVEIVDLISDDDSPQVCTDSEDESGIQSVIRSSLGLPTNRVSKPKPAPIQNPKLPRFPSTPNCRIIACSRPRQPVFKPIVNNEDSGIFRNWKPESMTRLINPGKSSTASNPTYSPSKLLTSLKSIPSNPSLDFNKYPPNAYKGGTCKSQIHGQLEEGSSPEFLGPEAVITID